MKAPGIELKEYRQKQGMSQSELAELLIIDQVQVSYYEKGTRKIPDELMDTLVEASIVSEDSKSLREEAKSILDSMSYSDFMLARDEIKKIRSNRKKVVDTYNK